MKEISYDNFIELLKSQDCYFINSFENAAIRSELKEGTISYYVKFKGEDEFEASIDNTIVDDAIREHTVISKSDYEAY